MENTDNKEVKEKVSKAVTQFSSFLEKSLHTAVDTGVKVKDKVNQAFKETQEHLEGIMDYLGNEILTQEELQNGDLVIPTTDVCKDEPGRAVIHPKGEVFEYDESIQSLIKTPLTKPTPKQAAKYGAVKELKVLQSKLTSPNSWTGLDSYINSRLEFYSNEK